MAEDRVIRTTAQAIINRVSLDEVGCSAWSKSGCVMVAARTLGVTGWSGPTLRLNVGVAAVWPWAV